MLIFFLQNNGLSAIVLSATKANGYIIQFFLQNELHLTIRASSDVNTSDSSKPNVIK